MSRGRAIAGDAALMARVDAVLDAVVGKPREREKLAEDVASMRARIEREKPAKSVFDVKLAQGGLMDCEFAAQFLVLAGLKRVAGETMLETLERAERRGDSGAGRTPSAWFPQPRCRWRCCSLRGSPASRPSRPT